ncbi:hypothetical protein Tco_1496051 [Tanacetum coccineum]
MRKASRIASDRNNGDGLFLQTKDLIDAAVTVGPADDDHLVTFNSNSSTATTTATATAATTYNQQQWSFLILLMSLLHAFIDSNASQ